MKKNYLYYFILFGLGFYGYGLIEILWRGYTHPSMSLAGGIIFFIVPKIIEILKPYKMIYKCITCGILITFIELIFGLYFNIYLKIYVWDYSMFRYNFLGQICVTYSVLWCFLSLPIIYISDKIKNNIVNNYKMSNKTEITEL